MIDNLGFAVEGGVKVLMAGLILGAGLPMIYAFGIKALAWGAGGAAEVSGGRPNPAGKPIAFVCFAIVIAAVGLGLSIILASGFGKAVSFENVYPTFVDKH